MKYSVRVELVVEAETNSDARDVLNNFFSKYENRRIDAARKKVWPTDSGHVECIITEFLVEEPEEI